MDTYSLVKGEENPDSSESDNLTDVDLFLETKQMKCQHRGAVHVLRLLSLTLLIALGVVTIYAFWSGSTVSGDELCARRLSLPGKSFHALPLPLLPFRYTFIPSIELCLTDFKVRHSRLLNTKPTCSAVLRMT